VLPDQDPSTILVNSLEPAIESMQSKSVVDTTGILNSEESRYFGVMTVSGVKYDVGGDRQIVSYSRVSLSDRNQAVEVQGRRVGFLGLDAGKVQIDGLDMVKSKKLLRIPDFLFPGRRDTAAGVEYILANRNGRDAKDFNFRHNSRFEWKVGGNPPLIRPFNVPVQTPEEVTVTTPKSSSVISKSEDLRVRWNGKIKGLRLVISGLRGSELQPYFQISVKENSDGITIPAKVLNLLPTDTVQTYIFSFINSNRSIIHLNEFPEEILVVASSVHNIVLTVL